MIPTNLNELKAVLKREPVRLRIYALAVAVAGYLVVKGYIDPADQEFILGALGIVLATENVRGKVTRYEEPGHSPEG